MGQLKPDDGPPVFGPCRLLDYELEFGAFVGAGQPSWAIEFEMDAAMDHLFGLVILNDWSARDVQKWEYQPLGPVQCQELRIKHLALDRDDGGSGPVPQVRVPIVTSRRSGDAGLLGARDRRRSGRDL